MICLFVALVLLGEGAAPDPLRRLGGAIDAYVSANGGINRFGYSLSPEVPIPAGSSVTGVVGADQVKSLDWRARKASRIGAVPEEVVAEVVRRLKTRQA